MAVTVGNGVVAGPFTPNGVTTSFAFEFRALAKGDLTVYRGAPDDWDAVDPSLYDVAVNTVQGGTVQFTAAPAAGYPLYIAATPLFDQGTEYPGGEAPFTPKSLNAEFDRAAMRAVVLKERVDRAVVVPRGEEPLPAELPGEGEVWGNVDGRMVGVPNGAAAFAGAVIEATAQVGALVEQAADHAGEAGDQAGIATTQAGIASGQQAVASAQATVATAQAVIATSAKDLILAALVAGKYFVTPLLADAKTAGLAAVANGESFYATGGDVDYIGFYTDTAGVAVEKVEGRIAKPSLLNNVPTGSALQIFTGEAPDNVGVTGDRGYSTDRKLNYLARTGTGWAAAIAEDGTLVPKISTIYDLARAPLPAGLITCVRAQGTTDLTFEDDRTSYATFAANEPLWHPTRGYLSFQISEQLAPTPVNPGNGSFTFNAPSAGRYIVWGKGAGTALTAPGDTSPATATGFGSRTLADIGYQVIVVTTPGNIKVTLSGTSAATRIQCEYNPLLPTLSVPTPFMPTTGVRNADQLKATGALAAVIQAAAGYVEIDARVPVRATSAQNTILGMANYPVFFASGPASLTYYDTVEFISVTLGSRTFADATPPRLAFSWDAATLRYAMGDRREREAAHTLAAGLSRATICLGARYNSDIYGQDSLNGAISRIAFANTAALVSREELYRRYSPIRLPTLADMMPTGFDAKRDMPETVARMALLLANPATEVLPIFVLGNSAAAGVPVRSTSWPLALAARLFARGMPVYTNSFTGTNGTPWTGGTNAYDPRATYTGGAPSGVGLHPSNAITRIPAGTSLPLAFSTTLTKLQVWTTTGPGNGSYQVSTGSGPIAPDGGGSATVSTDGALALAAKTFTADAAATWTITAIGADVFLHMAIDKTPGRIQIVNGAISGATASTLATDTSVTNSLWELPRALGGPLTLLTPDHGNSSINSVAMATYRAAVAAQIAKAKAIADVIAMTHMTFAPQLAPDARDRAYAMAQSAIAQNGGAKVFDLRAWEAKIGYATMHAAGWYFEADILQGLHFNGTGNDRLVAAPVEEMMVAAWIAAGGTLT
ncbi:hypothetical protein [Sphingomonas sp. CCH9-E2]|uniref:hypothetical protein n=1 Tax=Sphingomonas sp. CCH9-E2 TaxID=1768776 RepID=UPI000AFE4082|nr:hypothetical protein [Sphingomonas sp. CCH9-E2]